MERINGRFSLGLNVPPNPENDFDETWAITTTKKKEGIRNLDGYHHLEPEKIQLLKENVPAPRIRNELIIMMLYDTGVRRGELAQIQLEDIDHDEQLIDIPALKSPKPRKVTYGLNRTGRLLDDWLDGGYRDTARYARDSPYLFPTDMGKQMDPRTVNDIVTQAADNAGIQEPVADYADQPDENGDCTKREYRLITAHTLRHSHGVQAIKSKIDIRRLAESMGHIGSDEKVNLDTTLTYLQMVEQEYIDESRKFEPGF